jgi:hypothetical protein
MHYTLMVMYLYAEPWYSAVLHFIHPKCYIAASWSLLSVLTFAFLLTSSQRFPVPEAVQYYVLLLAHVLVDPDFLSTCLAHRSGTGNC